MEFEVPERHVLRPTLSTDMVQWNLCWERQKRCYIGKGRDPWHNNAIIKQINNKNWEREDEDKRMVELYLFLQLHPL